jgi:hypothetical protein
MIFGLDQPTRPYKEMHMKQGKYSYTELGMLLGLFVGGGLATILFASTGKAFYFAIVGIGLAFGLGLGAAFDGSQRHLEESKNRPDKEDK